MFAIRKSHRLICHVSGVRTQIASSPHTSQVTAVLCIPQVGSTLRVPWRMGFSARASPSSAQRQRPAGRVLLIVVVLYVLYLYVLSV